MHDIAAAQGDLKGVGPLGVIGFCMGGTAAFLAACRLPGLSAAVAYYGGMIGKFADEKPKCPLQMHFGEKDEGIPMSTVDEIKKKQPQAEIYVYPRRRAWLLLRRARELQQGRCGARLEPHAGIPRQAYEEIGVRRPLTPAQAGIQLYLKKSGSPLSRGRAADFV